MGPALFTAALALTPDEPDHPLDYDSDAPDAPQSPQSPEGHGRQKSSAALHSFEPSAFLARISAPSDTIAGAGDCCSMPVYFVNSWALVWSSDQ